MKYRASATSGTTARRKIFYGWWIVAAGGVLSALGDGTYWLGFSVYFLPVNRDFGLSRAANSLHRSNSALGAFLRHKKAQLGTPQAITATAHKLARLIYSMLKYGQEYVDAGQDYCESRYRERALRNLARRAKELGYNLVATQQPTPTAAFP